MCTKDIQDLLQVAVKVYESDGGFLKGKWEEMGIDDADINGYTRLLLFFLLLL